MSDSEILISHALLSVMLAGFSALLLNIATGGMDQKHLGWAVRALTNQAVFTVFVTLCGLGILSTNLSLSQIWQLCSLVYVVIAIPAVKVSIWDGRRAQRTGTRPKSKTLLRLIWVITAFCLVSNITNTIIEEPIFAYFFWGLVGNTIVAFILFTRNIYEYTNNPGQTQGIGQTQEVARELR